MSIRADRACNILWAILDALSESKRPEIIFYRSVLFDTITLYWGSTPETYCETKREWSMDVISELSANFPDIKFVSEISAVESYRRYMGFPN